MVEQPDPHPRHARPTPLHAAGAHQLGLPELRIRFRRLHADVAPHPRGVQFEELIFDLLQHAGLDPRRSYKLGDEQIDGSFVLDSSVFLLETKWTSRPLTRMDADLFACKLRRKGRNTLGLIVSVGHFSRGFLHTRPDGGTPYVALDGDDLEDVLDARIDITELLRQRRRHLEETGEPWSARIKP